jgi:HTH-type transcriptional regulator, competence development regulator
MKVMRMSDELFLKRAAEEDGCMISAVGLQPLHAKKAESGQQLGEPIRFAFSTLISYRRRALRMTMEDVAQKAKVELDELLEIEENLSYVPEVRTVHRLADLLKLPIPQLLVLSGNAKAATAELTEAAVRFAARSRAVEKLNPEQSNALNEFVKVLVEQKGKETVKK